jgi:hypothetical protein
MTAPYDWRHTLMRKPSLKGRTLGFPFVAALSHFLFWASSLRRLPFVSDPAKGRRAERQLGWLDSTAEARGDMDAPIEAYAAARSSRR